MNQGWVYINYVLAMKFVLCHLKKYSTDKHGIFGGGGGGQVAGYRPGFAPHITHIIENCVSQHS